METKKIITESILKKYFSNLDILSGDTLMIHASIKSIGWLVGGPQIIINALLDLIGSDGSLLMYVGWEDSPYIISEFSQEKQNAYLNECPPYNPKTSRAVVDWSVLAEVFRNYPQSKRSDHPDGSFCAIGKNADYLVEKHSFKYGYGFNSPLAKLVELKGKVLMIGAPLDTVTLIHYSESLAKISEKKIVKYKMPIIGNLGKKEWVEIEEFDTSNGIVYYDGDYFIDIMENYISNNKIASHKVGEANSYLFDAYDLSNYAINWLENNLEK